MKGKIISSRKIILISLFFLLGGFVVFAGLKSKLFLADILRSNTTGINLWYLQGVAGTKTWEIPTKIGGVVELPLGIASRDTGLTAPVDSIEFRVIGIPDFLTFEAVSNFPGFHVDVAESKGTSLATTDLSVFITPEEFTEEEGIPEAPNEDQLGKLITESNEILRLAFRVSQLPTLDTEQISIQGIIVERNGDFTRHFADADPAFPGDNPGTITIEPLFTNYPHIVSTKTVSANTLELDFDTPLLSGSGNAGSQNSRNYYIYKCGETVPAPAPTDPNAIDTEDCRLMNQQSITDPGEPESAELVAEDNSKVRIMMNNAIEFTEGANYIVLVKNVGNSIAEQFIPETGIYSQPFLWTKHPTVSEIIPLDVDLLHIVFNNPVCAADQPFGASNPNNYEIFACNLNVSIEECVERNVPDSAGLNIIDAMYNGNRVVSLLTEPQQEDVWYVVKIKNLRDDNCTAESAIAETVEYYSEQFAGYNSQPAPGELAIALSNTESVHLPWRDEIHLKPVGGIAPYGWEIDPVGAGTIEIDDTTANIVFRPRLIDENNQAVEQERDVMITLLDGRDETTSIKLHILRRGDLGGRSDRLLDKTDVQDVNDISAGWQR